MDTTRASQDQPNLVLPNGDFRALFEALPGLHLALLADEPNFTIVAVSSAYAQASLAQGETFIGRSVFEVHPDRVDLRTSLWRVLATKAADTMNSPVLAPDGTVRYIIHRIEAASRAGGEEGPRLERRQAALLRLMQGQRETTDPDAMMRAASEAAGQYLAVDRAGFFETRDDVMVFEQGWTAGRLPLLEGEFPVVGIGSRYLAEVRAGKTIGISDTGTSPLTSDSRFRELGTVSLIGAPIIRNGRWHAGLYVNHAEVREWMTEEIDFVREVADRTWDAIERARAVAALQKSEKRFRFLGELDEATRALTDPHDVTQTAARLLCELLGGNRCAYADVEEDQDTCHVTGDYNRGVESIAGSYTFTQFGGEVLRLMHRGEPVMVADSATDRRTANALGFYRAAQIRSMICVPLLKSGRLVGAMAVHQITPRDWLDEEVELVQSVARRCWESIERAHVARELSEREQRFRFLAESIPQLVWTATPDGLLDYVNRQGYTYFGANEPSLLGIGWLEWVHPEDREKTVERWKEALRSGAPYETGFRLRRGFDSSWRWHLVRAHPLVGEGGKVLQWFGTCTDVEDQNRAEELVEEDRRRWRELLMQTPAGIAVLRGPEHRFEWLNADYARLVGRAPEATIGKTVLETFPEVEGRSYAGLLDKVYRTGESVAGHESPLWLERGDGIQEDLFVNFVYLATRNAEGEIDGVFVHVNDVTDIVKARKNVENSAQRFRAAVQANSSLLWTNNARGEMEGEQPGWEAFTGQSPEEYQGYGWSRAVHPDDAQPTIDAWNEAVAEKRMFLFEHRVRRHDGIWRRFSVRAVPVFDAQGAIREWVGVHNDITEERNLLMALQQSEARFRQAIDSMPQLVWSTLPDGYPDLYNKQWFEYTGLSYRELKGDEWSAILHPDDRLAAGDQWQRSLQSGQPFEVEFRCRRADGQYRWFLGRATPIRNEAGQIIRWFGTSTDIEERKKAESAILTKQKLESIGLLAGGIAHDFNNLLVGVLGGASYAADSLPEDHLLQPILAGIVSAGERAAHLTRQMLAYAGKGSFLVEQIDLGELVRNTCDLIRASIPSHVELVLDLPRSLPVLEADAGQIQQVVMNLIINAAEAIDGTRGGRVAVKTSTAKLDSTATASMELVSGALDAGWYVVFEVRDNGSGMNDETKIKIFDPFFTTKFTGRGLGLSAVQGILRTHKGALELTSSLGKGSTFRVFLPASRKTMVNDPAPEVAARGAGMVLVVDDEAIVRKTCKASLERAGFTVALAESGEQAVQRLLDNAMPRVALIVLDMSMPGMNGKEVMHEIRSFGIGVPVLICSGYSESVVYGEFSGLDIAGFLQKPFTSRQLAVKIKSLLTEGAEK